MRCLPKNPADRYASGESLAASLYPFARNQPEPVPHRLNFSWFQGPLRPAEAWVFGATVAATLVAIPVGHNFYRTHHQRPTASESTQAFVSTSPAPPKQPMMNFNSPVADESANPGSAAGKAAQAPAAQLPTLKTAVPSASGSLAAALVPETSRRASASSSATPVDASTRTATASGDKASVPISRSAPATIRSTAPAASLGIEISSAIDGATLAVFVDQQLLATSPLSITRPGESLRLERPLSAGPHEFRIALYRQDKTLQIEKQGLAELQPGPSNQLTVRVFRRSRMLVKRNADLDILWPSASPSSKSGSSNSASKTGSPDRQAAKASTPLVARSVPSSR